MGIGHWNKHSLDEICVSEFVLEKMKLFNSLSEIVIDEDYEYRPNFFEKDYFPILLSEIQWEQHSISMYGKTHPLPRLEAWYGDRGAQYSYSGIKLNPLPWDPILLEIKMQLESVTQQKFNSVLCNLYRDGRDYVSWHADDEKELGVKPFIASCSFGAERKFQMKTRRPELEEKKEFTLENRSLFIMKNQFQNEWVHQIPKQLKIHEARINLTFRQIKTTDF